MNKNSVILMKNFFFLKQSLLYGVLAHIKGWSLVGWTFTPPEPTTNDSRRRFIDIDVCDPPLNCSAEVPRVVLDKKKDSRRRFIDIDDFDTPFYCSGKGGGELPTAVKRGVESVDVYKTSARIFFVRGPGSALARRTFNSPQIRQHPS